MSIPTVAIVGTQSFPNQFIMRYLVASDQDSGIDILRLHLIDWEQWKIYSSLLGRDSF